MSELDYYMEPMEGRIVKVSRQSVTAINALLRRLPDVRQDNTYYRNPQLVPCTSLVLSMKTLLNGDEEALAVLLSATQGERFELMSDKYRRTMSLSILLDDYVARARGGKHTGWRNYLARDIVKNTWENLGPKYEAALEAAVEHAA